MIWFIIASMGLLYLAMALEVRAGEAGVSTLWLIRLALPTFTIARALLYASAVFPQLPRELGGPRARCVVIDVASNALSPETLMLLGAEPPAAAAAVRSAPIWLRFEGGGTLVVSREREMPLTPFRLRTDDVALVMPSDGCGGSE
jgi:hypothetical protein